MAEKSTPITIRSALPAELNKIDVFSNEDPEKKVDINTDMLESVVSVAAKGVSGQVATSSNFKFEPKKFATLNAKNMSIKERLQGMNIVDFKKFSKSVNKTFAAAVNINMD